MFTRKTTIFITGATGYVGGSVLERLLKHADAKTFYIFAIVRDEEKAKILESKFSIDVVRGTLQDPDKLESLAENAHVVFHCANADDEPAARAILSGMKRRHEKFGDIPILIHTSGTGVLVDDARGEYATETIYSDTNIEQIESIPPTAIHRNVDLLVVDADTQGYARTHIILPSTIYGIAEGALFDADAANPHSIQIPNIIKATLGRKRAGVVGKGKAIWPDVHIHDTADLYIQRFDSIRSDPDNTGHGWEGFYFGENGEHSWYQISRAIGEALVALGIAEDAEPTPFTTEELVKYFRSERIGLYNGTNSRCRADRAHSIGWRPRYTTEDMLRSIKPEVEVILKQRAGAVQG